MRQYFQSSKAGSLKNLAYFEGPIPEVTEGKVLVGVKAVGLNFADVFALTGLYSATPQGPFIPGLEFSGEVLETASPLYKKGAKVMGVTRFGGYDSHIVADPNYLMPLPEGWSYSQGAAYPVQTLTAYYALKDLGNIQSGQTILIHSAAGGVGLQAHRIAKKFDAYTIGMVGNKEKLKVLAEEGFDKGIVRGPTFQTDLREALGDKELNLVLEATGGEYFQHSYDALAPMGRLVTYGSAQFTPTYDRPNYLSLAWKYLARPKIDPLQMISANKSVLAFNLIWLYEKNSLMKRMWDEIDKLGLPAPKVGHEFPFKEALKALDLFKSGTTVGKVVLTID